MAYTYQMRPVLDERRFNYRRIMYHGTSTHFLKSIMASGLSPEPTSKTWQADPDASATRPSRASLRGVYVTPKFWTAASSAGNTKRKFGGEELFIVIEAQEKAGFWDEDRINHVAKDALQRGLSIPGRYHFDLSHAYSVFDVWTRMKADPRQRREVEDKFTEAFVEALSRDWMGGDLHPEHLKWLRKMAPTFLHTELDRAAAYHIKDERASNYGSRSFIRAVTDSGMKMRGVPAEDYLRSLESQGIYTQFEDEAYALVPTVAQAEKAHRRMLDRISKEMARYETEKAISPHRRLQSVVGFSGRNRIIAMYVEPASDEAFEKLYHIYGKRVPQFEEDYRQAVSGSVEVVEADWRRFERSRVPALVEAEDGLHADLTERLQIAERVARLDEVLDRPFPYDLKRFLDNHYEVTFTGSDGTREYYANLDLKARPVREVPRFLRGPIPGGSPTQKVFALDWEVHFWSRKVARRALHDWEFGVTGTAREDVFRVFATIRAVVAEVHKRETEDKREGAPPGSWWFYAKASEQSRARLYERFAKRFASTIGWRTAAPRTRSMEGEQLVGYGIEDPEQPLWAKQPVIGVWRRAPAEVLTEAAKGPAALGGSVGVLVSFLTWGFEVDYWDLAADDEPKLPRGRIEVIHSSKGTKLGPCSNAYVISQSNATPGYGPMLYDVAMEVATLMGGGLAADRMTVSQDAHKVWSYYDTKRRDVKRHQLDNLKGELTPRDKSDDCKQRSATVWSKRVAGDRMKWMEDPTSRRYTKRPETIRALAAAGRFGVRSMHGGFVPQDLRQYLWTPPPPNPVLSYSDEELDDLDRRVDAYSAGDAGALSDEELAGLNLVERERNYRAEYARETRKRKDDRCARNRARYKLIKKGRARVGDGKHVHHKDGNTNNNSERNLSNRDPFGHESEHKSGPKVRRRKRRLRRK